MRAGQRARERDDRKRECAAQIEVVSRPGAGGSRKRRRGVGEDGGKKRCETLYVD